jgi:sigma-B regulation protein RsbU (phosphoserine phosphatase)
MKKPKVLIVEDDKNYQEILKRFISRQNFEIRTASDGEEGLKTAMEWKPDILVIDWMMPVMDGLELTRKIKSDPNLKFSYIIMLTAKTETQDKVKGLEAGADDFVTKPCEFEEFIARIKAGLRIRELQQEIAELQHEVALLEMARTLGHEINNPLNIIFLALEIIERNLDAGENSKVKENLERISQASDRIKEIVQKLISLKRPSFKEYINGKKMLDLDK